MNIKYQLDTGHRSTTLGSIEVSSYQEGALPSLGNDPDDPDFIDDSDGYIDYGEMVAESVFLGDMPFAEIIDGIQEQFQDYINIEDKTNYVDIFYTQLHESLEVTNSNDEEDHPAEINEVLENLKELFVDTISRLFQLRLTISIMTVDDESTPEDEVEISIRRLYEYFILGAKDNFKMVIQKDLIPKIGIIPNDQDDVYFQRVEELLREYDPIITCMTPTEFIQFTGNDDILSMYEDGQVVGNFLRRYSSKLYKNDEFKTEIINSIVITQNLKEDILHGEQPEATN